MQAVCGMGSKGKPRLKSGTGLLVWLFLFLFFSTLSQAHAVAIMGAESDKYANSPTRGIKECKNLQRLYQNSWPTNCSCEIDGAMELTGISSYVAQCKQQAVKNRQEANRRARRATERQKRSEEAELVLQQHNIATANEAQEAQEAQNTIEQGTYGRAGASVAGSSDAASEESTECYDDDGNWNCPDPEPTTAENSGDSDHQESLRNGANSRHTATNEAKEACVNQCNNYIKHTTTGCSSIATPNTGCEGMCSQYLPNTNRALASLDFYNFIEEKWSYKRGNCFRQAKTTFGNEYTTECLEKIDLAKDHVETGGTSPTLLCGKGATKSDAQCDTWCQGKAQSAVEEIDQNIKVAEEFNDGSYDPSPAYAILTKDITKIVKKELSELQIVDNSGELTQERKEEGFRWWVMCEKEENMKCEAQVKMAVSEAVETCGELQSEAHKCCHTPEQCVGGGLAHALDGLGKMHVNLSTLGGQKKQCKAVQQTFGMYSGMQGLMATQCTRKASKCTSGCNEKRDEAVQAFQSACGVDPRQQPSHDESLSCTEDFFDTYRKQIVSNKHGLIDYADVNINKVGKECQRTGQEANRNIGDMTTNLGTALMASVKECGQKAKEQGWEWETPEVPEYQAPAPPDSTPGSLPDLPTPTLAGGGGDSTTGTTLDDGPPTQAPANPFDVEPELPDPAPEDAKGGPSGFGGLVQAGGGGGGGGMGGLPGGGGGGGGGGDYGRGGDSKRRKILQGYHGGKFTGYGGGGKGGNSRAGQGKRGWKGKGNKKKKRGVASLDLKKLFPKEKRNKKIGQFGSPHDDIFKRISNRIQYMCKTKRIRCQ